MRVIVIAIMIIFNIDIQCPDIPDPINGQIVFTEDADRVSPFDYGSIATYSCNTELTLFDGIVTLMGTVQRHCRGSSASAKGEWSGADYTCGNELCKFAVMPWFRL